MKLIRYQHQGSDALGLLEGEGIVALSLHDPRLRFIDAALTPEGWASVERLAGRAPDLAVADVVYLPPLSPEARVICVGLNYRSHVDEIDRDVPEHPTLFLRTHESIVGHRQPLVRPTVSKKFDYEGELAVLIGRPCRQISEGQVLSFVGGYACCNEGSIRDFQKHSVTGMTGKNFDATGSIGPWVVPTSDVPDPSALTLITRLNGNEVQRSGTDQLIYDIPRIVSYLSHCLELRPGDLIATGTPSGVGSRRDPPLWMVPGDRVEVEISRIGILRNGVVDASAAA